MTDYEIELWEKIKVFEIDDLESEFSFTDRLARENSWTMEFSSRVVLEYKRFMFLICIAEHPLTPSDQVDQVWHLHLIYTQSYWKDFCQNTLGIEVQHGPTKGGRVERDKYTNWYESTKTFYQSKFKHIPPMDIWPTSEERFSQINYTRVNRHQHWVIRKPKIFNKWKL